MTSFVAGFSDQMSSARPMANMTAALPTSTPSSLTTPNDQSRTKSDAPIATPPSSAIGR